MDWHIVKSTKLNRTSIVINGKLPCSLIISLCIYPSVYLSVHPYALLDKIAYEYAAHSQEFVRHFTKQYTLANMAHIWVFLPPHSLSLIFLLYLFLFVRKGEWEAFSKLRSEKSLTRCSKFRLCRASLVYDAEGYLSLVGCSAKE